MTDLFTKKSRTDTAIFAWYLAVRSRTSRTMYLCGIQFRFDDGRYLCLYSGEP